MRHEWKTTHGDRAEVACNGPSLDVPGIVGIEVPEHPHISERMEMALEILRLARLNVTLAQKAALLDEVSSALDDGRLFLPSREPGRTAAEALVDKIRALYRPKAKKET